MPKGQYLRPSARVIDRRARTLWACRARHPQCAVRGTRHNASSRTRPPTLGTVPAYLRVGVAAGREGTGGSQRHPRPTPGASTARSRKLQWSRSAALWAADVAANVTRGDMASGSRRGGTERPQTERADTRRTAEPLLTCGNAPIRLGIIASGSTPSGTLRTTPFCFASRGSWVRFPSSPPVKPRSRAMSVVQFAADLAPVTLA